MNFISIPLGDGINLTIAQRVAGGPWYASTKRMSIILGYPQCRTRAFIHSKLKPWNRGSETWVSVNCLKGMLDSNTPVFRKNMIETILSRVLSGAKYCPVLDEDPDLKINGRVETPEALLPVDMRMTKSDPEPEAQAEIEFDTSDPEIAAWLLEIEAIEGLIEARKEELSSTAHVAEIQAKRDTLIREANALDAELKRINAPED